MLPKMIKPMPRAQTTIRMVPRLCGLPPSNVGISGKKGLRVGVRVIEGVSVGLGGGKVAVGLNVAVGGSGVSVTVGAMVGVKEAWITRLLPS